MALPSQPEERPIIVIGAPRSGTTMFRYMLSAHPRLYVPPESNFIPRFFDDDRPLSPDRAQQAVKGILEYKVFFRDWLDPFPDPHDFVSGLADLRPRSILDGLFGTYARQHGAVRWGDKSPIYTSHVEELSRVLPTAQFVHIIRDGRDVALSMMRAYQGRRFFYVDLGFAARSWRRRVTAARRSGSRLGRDRYLELTYEALTSDPEAVLQDVCDFLGEEFAPEMTAPQNVARQHYHSRKIHAATAQPLTTASSRRWLHEMPERDQRLFDALAGDLLAELGYPVDPSGALTFSDRLQLARLTSKYAVVEAGRRSLRRLGVFHPARLLAGR
ncbi:MAG: sulfotransferase [Acidimicrobiia bacterium]|nr:sulfotransferase [Acidimicrobiia bacterium]